MRSMDIDFVEISRDTLFKSYKRVQLLPGNFKTEKDAKKLIADNYHLGWLLAIQVNNKYMLVAENISDHKIKHENNKYEVHY